MTAFRILLIITVLLCLSLCTQSQEDNTSEPGSGYTPLESIRVHYGEDSLQYGDLRIPQGEGPFPVVVIIHGGCWLSQYNLKLMDDMALDLAERGYVTWNLEYRRTEDPGGGWPGTFHDVVMGMAFISVLAESYPLSSDKIALTGHSAGGHLALWLGAYPQLDSQSALHAGEIPTISGVVSLAGITDLEAYYADSGCGRNVRDLLGGFVTEVPERYVKGSPISYLPLGIVQKLIVGDKDNIVPVSHITPYHLKAQTLGDQTELIVVPGANHFDVITPGSVAWDSIIKAFEELMQ